MVVPSWAVAPVLGPCDGKVKDEAIGLCGCCCVSVASVATKQQLFQGAVVQRLQPLGVAAGMFQLRLSVAAGSKRWLKGIGYHGWLL
ncbi:hypothetical protein GBA52_014894 [Prunus armeniaca]|nr:hypothetical protein GBA52_014894 [Prunus armeniaca]